MGLKGFVAVVVKREGEEMGLAQTILLARILCVHECVQVQQVSRLFAITAT